MNKHTPGPWFWHDQVGTTMPVLYGADKLPVCEFGSCREYYPSEGTAPEEADARLIASAPELLAALQEAKHMFDGEYPDHPTTKCIAAAIAKATGAA